MMQVTLISLWWSRSGDINGFLMMQADSWCYYKLCACNRNCLGFLMLQVTLISLWWSRSGDINGFLMMQADSWCYFKLCACNRNWFLMISILHSYNKRYLRRKLRVIARIVLMLMNELNQPHKTQNDDSSEKRHSPRVLYRNVIKNRLEAW